MGFLSFHTDVLFRFLTFSLFPPTTDSVEEDDQLPTALQEEGLAHLVPLFQEQEIDLDAFLTMTRADFAELGLTAAGDLDHLERLLAKLQALQSEGRLGEAMERFVRRQRRRQQREAQKAQASHSLMLAATGLPPRSTPSPPRLLVPGQGGASEPEVPSKRRSSTRTASGRRRGKGDKDKSAEGRLQSSAQDKSLLASPSSPTRRLFRRFSARETERDKGAMVKQQPGSALSTNGQEAGVAVPPLPTVGRASPELGRRRSERPRRPGSAG